MTRQHVLIAALLAFVALPLSSARGELSPVAVRCVDTAERFIALVKDGDVGRARLSAESTEKCIQLLKVRNPVEAHDVIDRAAEAIAHVK